jgi:hypothetical protein
MNPNLFKREEWRVSKFKYSPKPTMDIPDYVRGAPKRWAPKPFYQPVITIDIRLMSIVMYSDLYIRNVESLISVNVRWSLF